ncbi:MAG: nucleotidyltransferase [Deltaproteobacteria bacterium HGW-Deltaproteobacteria-15]|jgi:hypothetical protein|nr:MAG: nucleotidyltransferase [Deltaproteobacteria bacterium HGW-Deltaproteobacteria-15]
MTRSEILQKLAMFQQDQIKEFSVKDLYLFGSYAREEAREQSDVDILVESEPEAEIGLFEFARLPIPLLRNLLASTEPGPESGNEEQP